ncbi:hypothetical protein CMK10_16175 [Candidatus Poribacteria bacterium]|nr:hypothetical protein [Candidatus Poribacteria bacterium]
MFLESQTRNEGTVVATLETASPDCICGLTNAKRVATTTGKTLMFLGLINGNESCFFPNILKPLI